MRNCIIAVFCSYVNRLRQYCCIIRKNGARPWLLVGKGRRRDAGNGKQRSRLHSRLSQSLRRSYNRLGDPTNASAIPQSTQRLWEERAFRLRPANRRGANTFQMTSLCGKAAACQRSRFIRIHAQNGFARLLQKATEVRNKARAGSAEGRKNARKEAQDGTASPTLEGIRRFMRLAFCPLVVRRSAALPCGQAPPARLSPPARGRGGGGGAPPPPPPRRPPPPPPARGARPPPPPPPPAAGQPLPPNRRQRLCNSVQRERARVQWVSIPQTVPRCLPPSFAEYETDWKNRFSKKDVSCIYYDIRI